MPSVLGRCRSQERAGRWGCWRQPSRGDGGACRRLPPASDAVPALERLVGERQRRTPSQAGVTGNGRPGALGPGEGTRDQGPSLMATGTVRGRCPFPPFSHNWPQQRRVSKGKERAPPVWTPEPGHQADPSDLSLPSDLSSKSSAALSGGLTSSARPWSSRASPGCPAHPGA